MLIILPPSETKRTAPDAGPRLDIDGLAFPELNPMRGRVLDALINTSTQADGFERLRVGPALVDEVMRNVDLRESPTRPAFETYSGPLYVGIDVATLSGALRRRAARDVVIASSLWGAVRPDDRIPAYRLDVCARLVGIDRLEPAWRVVLPAVLADAAGPHAIVLDLRSPAYQAIGMPAGALDRVVTIRVLPEAGDRTIGNVVAKRVRGQVARHLLESAASPATPDDLADALSDRWSVRVDPPTPDRRTWTIRLRPSD